MIPKTEEQKRVTSLIKKSKPLGKRAINRISSGVIGKDNVKRCYFCQWEMVEQYQVFRYFEVRRNLRTKEITYLDEKFRNYFNCETKKQTIVALCFNGLASCKSSLPVFKSSSRLEVRGPHCSIGGWYILDDYHDSRCYDTYVKNVHPLFKSVRLTPHMVEELGSYSFLFELFKGCYKTQIETAVSWGDEYMVWCLLNPQRFAVGLKTFWHSVLLAKRHGFDFKKVDYKEYGDYLQQLSQLGYDLHSPNYLCPSDFAKAHDDMQRLIAKKREKERRERETEFVKKSAEEYNESYISRVGKFFDIEIKFDNLHISVLRSIFDIYEEGMRMRHCVYSCEYYKKEDSLILSARNDKGERVETIEYSISLAKVLQSRGACNKITDYHNKIVSEVEQHLPQLLKKAV